MSHYLCTVSLFSLVSTAEAVWGDWSAWSECTATCGGGRRTRRRSCEGGNTCVGRQTEYTDCNTDSCPEGWYIYIADTLLFNILGVTSSTPSSVPLPSLPSPASLMATPISGSAWSEWGSWSDCSQTCQGGTRYRRRQCQNGNDCEGSNVLLEYCNSDVPCEESKFLVYI